MFTVTLWTFLKKVDSTKQPDNAGTDFSCNILTPADIVAPVVEITASSDLTAYNYAYIAAFHRYYWIEGVSFDSGIWYLTMTCDVLATYKTQIGAASLYVLRAASSYDGDITDNYYPMINDIVQTRQESSETYSFNDGVFVVSIAGTDSTGNTTLYEMGPASFKSLLSSLYLGIDGFQFGDIIKSVVQKFGGNPTQLINGAMWFPQPFTDWTHQAAVPIIIGSWQSSVQGRVLGSPSVVYPVVSFDIDAHPQVSKGRYLNLSPYSQYQLYLPGIGQVMLDTTKLESVDSINILRTVDAMTGRIVYRVLSDPMTGNTNPPTLLFIGETQWGVPISLGGNNIGGNLLTSALGTVASASAAIASGGASAIIGAVAGGIGSTLSAMDGSSVGSSAGGSLAQHFHPLRLDTTFYKITNWDDTHNGRPLMQVKTLSTLSGFIMVQKGDVPIPGTSAEADRVKSYLEGGFFYE